MVGKKQFRYHFLMEVNDLEVEEELSTIASIGRSGTLCCLRDRWRWT